MSRQQAPVARAITFGDLEDGVWGAAWLGQEAFASVGVIGGAPAILTEAATLAGQGPGEDWRLEGDGVELVLAPAGDAVLALAGREPVGFDQLCRVDGSVTLELAQRSVACLGRRSARRRPFDTERFESLREVSAWYEPGEGVVLSSLRPRGARGHDADTITASLLEPTEAPPVVDPRLSTTYTATGEPARMSLELWLESDGDAEQFPRRITGETLGTRALISSGALEFDAAPLRCHSRGRAGAGAYLLIRSR